MLPLRSEICFLQPEKCWQQRESETGEVYQGPLSSIAPMVEITETKCCVVVVSPVDVELFDIVVHVLAELHILGSRSAAFILVCRDINPEGLQSGETVPCDQSLGPLPLYQLDALVVVSGTELAPVPPVVEVILPTARVCPNTDITDKAVLQTSPETASHGEQC